MARTMALSILAFMLFLAGCSPSETETSTSVQPEALPLAPAPAPTRDQTYVQVRASVQQLYDSGIVEQAFGGVEDDMIPPDEGSSEPRVDLSDCSSIYDFYPAYEGDEAKPASKEQKLAQVAYARIGLSTQLTALGYPSRLWKPLLDEWEEGSVDWILSGQPGEFPWDKQQATLEETIDTPFMHHLSTTLNAYRNAENPSLPETMLGGGCGAGEVQILVKTEPAGGTVQIISVFQRMLCSAKGQNPDDTRECAEWHEAGNGFVPSVVGDYRYQATWPDGGKRDGFLRFESLTDGDTVTLRR